MFKDFEKRIISRQNDWGSYFCWRFRLLSMVIMSQNLAINDKRRRHASAVRGGACPTSTRRPAVIERSLLGTEAMAEGGYTEWSGRSSFEIDRGGLEAYSGVG